MSRDAVAGAVQWSAGTGRVTWGGPVPATAFWTSLERPGGDVVGVIPGGLPSLEVPVVHRDLVLALLPAALVMALIGFMEATSISKAIAAQTRERIDHRHARCIARTVVRDCYRVGNVVALGDRVGNAGLRNDKIGIHGNSPRELVDADVDRCDGVPVSVERPGIELEVGRRCTGRRIQTRVDRR